MATIAIICGDGMFLSLAMVIAEGDQDQWAYTRHVAPTPGCSMLYAGVTAVGVILLTKAAAGKNAAQALGLRVPVMGIGGYIAISLATLGICALGGYAAQWMAYAVGEQYYGNWRANIQIAAAESWMEWAGVSGTIALSAGLGEEILFRGFLQGRLQARWHPAAAIGASSFVFSAAHLSPALAFALLPTGVWLGYVAWRTGSIIPGIVGHIACNLLIFLVVWMGQSEELALMSTIAYSAASVVGVICAVVLVRRWERAARETPATGQMPPPLPV